MSTRMLIDARHTEETRVAIVRGTRVEEFDYESTARQQLKGNIYLAKVTRVEPSLQAAFIEYGGNRHGFLAFSEIHPDYYQIPVEDREALLDEERSENALGDDEEIKKAAKDKDESDDEDGDNDADSDAGAENDAENGAENGAENEEAENGNGEEEIEETIRDRRRQRSMRRRYKIQEVIKKRQILLIQVVKEERGNKGAALTTYLSLAGRYCVLMPNTTQGGGISRKIGNVKDRKRLRTILDGLDVPDGMGCIIRTAGITRTKAEIKRDLDYMLRLWGDIRELTLKSIAPALTYEEGNLIKRTIRDLYDRSIDEVLVEGEEGFKTAKDFMKLLMPSHVKNIHHYEDKTPLFLRYQVESQLEAMLDPNVTLKSGGYLVINPTEALIAVDVNSGRSTREHNIEETALKTNLEAADEVGRQLRQRDLAGLIVIDFIDMEVRNNNRKVERRLKEAVKGDKARIQVGRISNFGLMEMSRQRLRPNLLEINTSPCPHCEATGRMRTIDSSALHVLRGLEEEAMRGRSGVIKLMVPHQIAAFILNQKRDSLVDIETKYGITVLVEVDENLIAPAFELKREGPQKSGKASSEVVTQDADRKQVSADDKAESRDGGSGGSRRSRRRGGRGRNANQDTADQDKAETVTDQNAEARPDAAADGTGDDEQQKPKRRRRRGRRGGRRRRGGGERPQEDRAQAEAKPVAEAGPEAGAETGAESGAGETSTAGAAKDAAPSDDKKPARRGRRKKASDDNAPDATESPTTDTGDAGETADKPKKAATRKPRASRAKTAEKGEVVASEEAAPKKPAARKRPTEKKAKKDDAAAPAKEKAPKKADDKAEEKPAAKKKAAAKKPAARKSAAKPKAEKAPKAAPPAKKAEKAEKPAKAAEKAEKADEPAAPKKKGWWNR